MTTARQFIETAAREASILGVGQTLLAEDVNTCFTLLTRMLSQWQVRRWLVPGLTTVKGVGNGLISNKIGPGQFYNAMRPDKILGGYFVQIGTGLQPVSFPLQPIWSYEDYIRVSLKQLQSFPQFFFYDGAFPNGNVFIYPVPSAAYEINLLIKLPIGFATSIATAEITNAGTGYTTGHYEGVPLVGGSGSGATIDIDINGGAITNVGISQPGNGYAVNDVMTIALAGAGFAYKVDTVTSSLDSTLIMPPEYEEAIHYNLALRICSAYNVQASSTTAGFAKIALNTIKNANAQVPTLRMPAPLRRNNGSYIFTVDAFN